VGAGHGEYIILEFSPPLPNQRKNAWVECFNQSGRECSFQIWVNTGTWLLERVDCRAEGLLPEDEDGFIVQAFTCFDEDVVVDPPPWLNVGTSSSGNMVVRGDAVAVVEHHW
jgi:hypothetical protein